MASIWCQTLSKKFEVVILTYNRPVLLAECLRSWMTQDLSDTRLIVSDNSTDSKSWEMLEKDFPTVEKRRMQPPLPGAVHFDFCRIHVTGQWYMFFHDDDLMLDGGWKIYKDAASKVDSNVIAIAANAFYIRGEKLTSELYNNSVTKQSKYFTSGVELFSHYCGPTSTHQPYPAYLYKASVVQPLYLAVDAGKYSDTSFLMKLCKLGKVLWLPTPALGYRTHGHNDSTVHNINDSFKLYNFARKFALSDEYSSLKMLPHFFGLFKAWQIVLHFRELKRSGRFDKHPWRKRIMFRYAAVQFLKNPQIILQKLNQMIHRKIALRWPL